jgi:hypothetical protein
MGLRDYGITLADPQTSQAGRFGALDEHGLFAMMALRLKLDWGFHFRDRSHYSPAGIAFQSGQTLSHIFASENPLLYWATILFELASR